MKFDIFNKDTWKIEPVDQEKVLKNKAEGQMGTVIGQLATLRDKLISLKDEVSKEQLIAMDLAKSNPEAYTLMDVKVHTAEGTAAKLVENITKFIKDWKNPTNTGIGWREFLVRLEEFKPYLKEDYSFYFHQKTTSLPKTSVSGNACWDVYLEVKLGEERFQKTYMSMVNELVEMKNKYEPIEATDDNDDDDSYDD